MKINFEHRILTLSQNLSKIKKVFSPHIRKIKTALNIKTRYKYSNFSILLPPEHLLPTFQKYHNLYDRFLPVLSTNLEPASTVIDVGANCGDTLAGMYDRNKNLKFVCIEPDETFFGYLQNNILRIKAIDKNAEIHAIRSLVGKTITGVSLEGSGGTKKAVMGNKKKSISSQSLDGILSCGTVSDIRLLKSDVDGFDYDVIDSAETIIASYNPIIFFECQFDYLFQKNSYEKTIVNLEAKGYTEWIVFDNFGEVVLRTNDLQQIFHLFNYLWRQNVLRSTRTIYYYDILTFTKKDNVLIDKVINDYCNLV
jgi:FkbM family methyltransferase